MNRDISSTIIEAATRRDVWSELELERALDRVLEIDSNVRVDWDPEAGEHWASLLKERNVLGFLHAEIPLGIFIHGVGDGVARDLRSHGLTILLADGYDEPRYKVSREAMEAAFPYAPLSEEWDDSGVSIHDLWYETVT